MKEFTKFQSQVRFARLSTRRLASSYKASYLSAKCTFFREFVCVVHLETNSVLVPFISAYVSVDVADMAEAAAIVRLVASIASIVDLSAKVVS